ETEHAILAARRIGAPGSAHGYHKIVALGLTRRLLIVFNRAEQYEVGPGEARIDQNPVRRHRCNELLRRSGRHGQQGAEDNRERSNSPEAHLTLSDEMTVKSSTGLATRSTATRRATPTTSNPRSSRSCSARIA